MKLTDLNPKFYGSGGHGITNADGSSVPRREGVLLAFDCPKCGPDGLRHGGIGCMLDPPMDGGPCIASDNPRQSRWNRTGDSFETMTLSPSILNRTCGAHFFIVQGRITADQEGKQEYKP